MQPHASGRDWQIFHGDCSQLLPQMHAESIDCCVTSPPYWALRDFGSGNGQLGLERTPTEYVDRLVELFRHVRRVLKRSGTLWIVVGDKYAPDGKWGGTTGGKHRKALHGASAVRDRRESGLKPKDLVGIPWLVAFALRTDGWWLRSAIIWNKPNAMVWPVRDRPPLTHEYVFLMSRSRCYFYDGDAIAEPLQTKPQSWGQDRTRRKDPGAQALRPSPIFRSGSERVTWGNGKTRRKRSVWTIWTVPFSGAHYATFPPKLVEPCILAGCPPGGVVLDPFAGTGTVGAVCLQHNRRFVGIELVESYCRMATTRIREADQEAVRAESERKYKGVQLELEGSENEEH